LKRQGLIKGWAMVTHWAKKIIAFFNSKKIIFQNKIKTKMNKVNENKTLIFASVLVLITAILSFLNIPSDNIASSLFMWAIGVLSGVVALQIWIDREEQKRQIQSSRALDLKPAAIWEFVMKNPALLAAFVGIISTLLMSVFKLDFTSKEELEGAITQGLGGDFEGAIKILGGFIMWILAKFSNKNPPPAKIEIGSVIN
jgi:hypothetical protein